MTTIVNFNTSHIYRVISRSVVVFKQKKNSTLEFPSDKNKQAKMVTSMKINYMYKD